MSLNEPATNGGPAASRWPGTPNWYLWDGGFVALGRCAYLMALSGLTYLVRDGWRARRGFSPPHTIAIVLAEVLNATWMTWLLVVAGRMPLLAREPRRARW